ncbi:hypothetical protein JZ751_024053 [Albula glossodonta]|uniref:protein-tyrosine-phosphatase n=1 Tax=Albula glossodonta TaxID=121402 RepID=A0A8T2NGT4_9TELE|nr:hypothetical protein JZ751_024053 [Albula glossodonta]
MPASRHSAPGTVGAVGTTGEVREIYHFHYTAWPDFGVPESPASFLNFLFKVRESGSLGVDHGPAVVHCSAGIGRSGTFSLVDTCLVLLDMRKDPLSVDIKKILLDMRKFRMGLIQTPDQLRFSYMAIIEGRKYIMGDPSVQKQWKEQSKEDQAPVSNSPPPAQTLKHPIDKFNGSRLSYPGEVGGPNVGRITGKDGPCKEQDIGGNVENNRKRHREERLANAASRGQQFKQRMGDTGKKRKRARTTDT